MCLRCLKCELDKVVQCAHMLSVLTVQNVQDCTRLYILSVWVGVCRAGSQAQSTVRGHHQTVAPVLGRHRLVSSEQHVMTVR